MLIIVLDVFFKALDKLTCLYCLVPVACATSIFLYPERFLVLLAVNSGAANTTMA